MPRNAGCTQIILGKLQRPLKPRTRIRPHLANPYWTLHAAAALGDQETRWPAPYHPGRDQMMRLAERGEGMGIRV